MRNRIKVGVVSLASLMAMSVAPAVFAANQGGVQQGSTIIGWKYTETSSTNAGITVVYSNNQYVSVDLGGFSWIQNTPSWTNPDAVAPLMAAYKYEPAQVASIFPTGINLQFSPDVAAALTVQQFNPSQVGGQSLAPSPSTLTSTTESWLQKAGYGSALTTYLAQSGTASTSPAPTRPSSGTGSGSSTTTTQPSQSLAPTSKSTQSQQPPVSSATTTKQPTVTQAATTSSSKPLPVASQSQTTPVTVSPAPSSSVSVPLPPKTPYLAHHKVSRSHAVVAAGPHHPTSNAPTGHPWPWIAGGVIVVGGAAWLFVRRRMV